MWAVRRTSLIFAVTTALFCYSPATAQASMLTFVRDTISTSAPGFTADHVIEFTVAHAIPASGHITIIPQDQRFSIPVELSAADVALSIATSGPYVARSVSSAPSVTDDGVSVTSGMSGSLAFTLSSGTGIPAGARVRIAVGSDSAQIRNPVDIDSYRIFITTTDAGSQALDNGTTMIAVVAQVAVTSLPTSLPPTRTNGLPSGIIEANNPSVELSLNTDKPATCRYATTTGVTFDAMPYDFSNPTTFVFTYVVTNVQNNTGYTYYVRCRDLGGNTNEDDYVISFSVKPTPTTNTSLAGTGSGGNGGSGDFPGGSSVLFLSNVTLVGWTSPGSAVRILKDGVVFAAAQSQNDGSFRAQLTGLERGLYTFVLSSKDPSQHQSSGLSTTLTLSAGTTNTITDLVIPPTVVLDRDSVAVGESARVSGFSVPGATVEISLKPQGGAARAFSASTTPQRVANAGAWTLTIPSAALPKGTYSIRARTVITAQQSSDFSAATPLGVGEPVTPVPNQGGATQSDISGDGKVNLVDFSILLTNWGKAGAGDFNGDGVVNLADFSIMLFNWTG